MAKTRRAMCSLVAKFLELVLAGICLALLCAQSQALENVMSLYDLGNLGAVKWSTINTLEYITFGGFVVICPILIVIGCCTNRVPRTMDIICCIVGLVMFMVTGGLVLYTVNQLSHPEKMLTSGISNFLDKLRVRRDLDDFKRNINDLDGKDNLHATGIMSIINGFVFFFDLLLVCGDSSAMPIHHPTGHVILSQS